MMRARNNNPSHSLELRLIFRGNTHRETLLFTSLWNMLQHCFLVELNKAQSCMWPGCVEMLQSKQTCYSDDTFTDYNEGMPGHSCRSHWLIRSGDREHTLLLASQPGCCAQGRQLPPLQVLEPSVNNSHRECFVMRRSLVFSRETQAKVTLSHENRAGLYSLVLHNLQPCSNSHVSCYCSLPAVWQRLNINSTNQTKRNCSPRLWRVLWF